METSSSSSSQNRVEPLFYYCDCGEKMYVRTSWTDINPARRFVKCPKVKTRYCTKYRFLDAELPSDYYKNIVYQLRMEVKNKPSRQEIEEDAESNMVLMKNVEELTLIKSKLGLLHQLYALLVAVLALLVVLLLVVVMK